MEVMRIKKIISILDYYILDENIISLLSLIGKKIDKVFLHILSNNSNELKRKYILELNKVTKKINCIESYSLCEDINVGYEAYILWNNEINKIYSQLSNILKDSKMKRLEKNEVFWIHDKDHIAKKCSKKYYENNEYYSVLSFNLARLTRDRCYYLVEKYM
ncbi:MAG: hypothetical protein Q4B63_09470 [Clostridium perfringens]|nr:hypothetical protein [Clostridium perfringens]